jgi:hypothetical protein
MKALEILRFVQQNYKSYNEDGDIDEAIAELEARIVELEALQATVTTLEERLFGFIDTQAQDTSTIIQMLKRITELEELQAPKTCETCRYCKEDSNDTSVWIDCTKPNSPMTHSSLTDEHGVLMKFGCIYHEPKDTK